VSSGDSVAPEADTNTHVRFSDGSDVQLASGARISMKSLAVAGAAVAIESGTISAAVVHRDSGTAWEFLAGPFAVHVVGTAFDLGWDPSAGHMRLVMREGVVRVDGCGVPAQEVRAPASLDLGCAVAVARQQGTADAGAGDAQSAETGSLYTASTPVSAPPLHSSTALGLEEPAPEGPLPTLDELVAAGKWAEAYSRIAPDFDKRIGESSPDTALHWGDIARISGHNPQAIVAYRRAEQAALPLASLQLAKLLLSSGDSAGALAAADRAAAAGGATGDDAAALAVEVLLVSGQADTARQRAQHYIEQLPTGRHIARMHRLLDPAGAPAGASQ
jgi:FecR protein